MSVAEEMAADGARSGLVAVLDSWRGFNLSHMMDEMEQKSLKISEHREASVDSRKKLAQQTKAFRQFGEDEQLRTVGKLMKAYQEEIDSLTRRSAFAELSFLNLLSAMDAVRDPVPFLAKALAYFDDGPAQVQRDLELVQLRKDADENRDAVAALRSAEQRICALEDSSRSQEAKLEERVAAQVASRIARVEEQLSLQLDIDEKLQRNLKGSQDALAIARREHAQSQEELFALRAQNEEHLAAHTAAMEVLSSEADRSAARIQQLERELLEAKEAIESTVDRNQVVARSTNKISDLEATLAVRDSQLVAAKLELEKANHHFSAKELEVHELHAAVDAERARASALEAELGSRPTSEEVTSMKKQLAIFRQVEFNVKPDDPLSESQIVDTVLVSKNKALQSKVVELEAIGAQLRVQSERDSERISALEVQNAAQRDLVARLEDDLMRAPPAVQIDSSPWIGRAGDAGRLSRAQVPIGRVSPDVLIRSGGSDVEEDAVRESSAMQIVSRQRDRFKEGMEALEGEVRKLKQDLDRARGDVERVTDDNVKLYEKIRFLQSYPSTSARVPREGGEQRRVVAGTDQLEGKYRQLYDESVNPFRAFSIRERARQYAGLTRADRATLSTGNWLMNHRHARLFLFLYSITLHLLIFGLLYYRSNCPIVDLDRPAPQDPL